MHEDLKAKYQSIFQILQRVKVIGSNFEQVIQDLGTIIDNDVIALKNSISLDSNNFSIRIQLRDISGIASNSLSYYLAHLWSEGSNEFGLNNYQLVLVLQNNLKYNPDIKSLTYIKKAIQEEYARLTGMEIGEFTIDDSFWKNTLFIVDNFASSGNSPTFNWLSPKINILVVGNKFYHGTTQISAISGFVIHEIGLSIPQIGIQLQGVAIEGRDVLIVEQELRQTFLQKTPTGQGVIDYTNPTLMIDQDGTIQLVGSERRAEQEYPLILDLINLLGQILENKENVENYHIRPFTKVADWYAAATTKHIDNKFYSYNIGGHFLVRTSFDNYFSDLGPIEQILPNIINDIKQTVDLFLRDHITDQDVAEGNGFRILIEKMQKYLIDNYILKSIEDRDSLTFGYQSNTVTAATFSATEERKQQKIELSKISNTLDYRPTYEKLAREIFLLQNEDLTSNIRAILAHSVGNTAINKILYTLVACLFIAEPSRCPQALLPTIMMLDLCEEQGVSWQDAIFQANLLDGVTPEYAPLVKTAISNFGGNFPMTHDGSYFQAQVIDNVPLEQRKILTWVEYKSILIMLNWLKLVQQIKPDMFELTQDKEIIDSMIRGYFSKRISGFEPIMSETYGIKINLDAQTIITHQDRLEDNTSGKRYVVFSFPKGQNLPFIKLSSNVISNSPQILLDDTTNDSLSETSEQCPLLVETSDIDVDGQEVQNLPSIILTSSTGYMQQIPQETQDNVNDSLSETSEQHSRVETTSLAQDSNSHVDEQEDGQTKSCCCTIMSVIKIAYDNSILSNGNLLKSAFKFYGKEAMNLLIELGEDKELAEQILLSIEELGIEKTLEIFFGDKVKASTREEITNDSSDVCQLKTQDDQIIEVINQIESIIGKEALSEIAGWHKYISTALSHNPLSYLATKLIKIIGDLVNNLEQWLDFGFVYESSDIDNQVTIILSQLENWVDFVASGITYVGLPPRYPDFDPDYDFGGSGGSGNSTDNSNIHDSGNILFLGNFGNSTIYE